MPKFYTDAEVNELSAKPGAKKVSTISALGQGVAQGGSFGFADEAAGLGTALAEAITPREGKRSFVELAKAYKEGRDAARAELSQAREERPGATFAGDILGSALTAAAPGGLFAKIGKPLLGTVKGAAALGGVEGAIRGAGETRDITSPSAIADISAGAAIGAGTGAAAQYGVDKLSKSFKSKKTPLTTAPEVAEAKPKPIVPTEADEKAAKILAGDRTTDIPTGYDAAYYRTNQKRIKTQPSLDEGAKNPASALIQDGIDKLDETIKGMENKAGELIEKSKFSVDVPALAQLFSSKIDEISQSGRAGTESGKEAIKRLTGYVESLNQINQKYSGKKVREFLQGLWEDNRAYYQPGRDTTFGERAVAEVAGDVNELLKGNVPGLEKHMEQYAPLVSSWKTIRKNLKLNEKNVPSVAGWFRNRVVYPYQNLEAGIGNNSEPMIVALDKMFDNAGIDFRTIVKDNLVFGRLFPEEAAGLQKGTATAIWTRAAEAASRKIPGISTITGLAKEVRRKGAENIAKGTGGLASKIVTADIPSIPSVPAGALEVLPRALARGGIIPFALNSKERGK